MRLSTHYEILESPSRRAPILPKVLALNANDKG